MITLINTNEMETFSELWTGIVYAYMGGLIVLFVVGGFVQYRINREEQELPDENRDFYSRVK